MERLLKESQQELEEDLEDEIGMSMQNIKIIRIIFLKYNIKKCLN